MLHNTPSMIDFIHSLANMTDEEHHRFIEVAKKESNENLRKVFVTLSILTADTQMVRQKLKRDSKYQEKKASTNKTGLDYGYVQKREGEDDGNTSS